MVRLSKKHSRAVEKVTGRNATDFCREALEAYFAWTDRGEKSVLLSKVWRCQLPGFKFNEMEQDLWDLMQCHTFHPYTVECWKEDFRTELLFLSDFTDPQPDYEKWARMGCPKVMPTFIYPVSYIQHAIDIYRRVFT